ncbi:MAG: hypothetical protein GFH27_549397n56, partial [Chloroflexi bacterium AL-W]|nr:hypothetical protein [Chloroflexi bacterium AL-W]
MAIFRVLVEKDVSHLVLSQFLNHLRHIHQVKLMQRKLPFLLGIFLLGLLVPGQSQTFLINENFSTATDSTPPSGWTNNAITGLVNEKWRFDNPGSRALNAPISSPAAIFDSDFFLGPGGSEDVALESPVFNAAATGAAVILLEFDHYFMGGAGGAYAVEVFDGTTWTSVMTGTATTANPASVSINIGPQVASVTNAQVRFRWTGNYSWYWIVDNVVVFTPLAVDVSPAALVAPVLPKCLGTSETVTVNVQNVGGATIDFAANPTTVAANISLSGVVQSFSTVVSTGTLAVGATLPVVVTTAADFSTPGTYQIQLITTATGGVSSADDTASATIINPPTLASPLPPVTFTGFNGSNLTTLSPGWFEASGFPPSSLGSPWVSDDFANVVGGPNGISAKVNLFTTGKNAWIIGPQVVPASNTVLSFDLALTGFGTTLDTVLGSDDQFIVFLSTDCGVSFFPLATFDATTPISNVGQYQEYPLGTYAGQTVIVGFFATEGTVNDPVDVDLFLDNIEVKNVFPVDAGLAAITSPAATGCLGTNETVTVLVNNAGTSALDFTTDPLTLSAVISGPIPQTFSAVINTGTLAVGASQAFDITALADFSAAGTYQISASVTTPNDVVQLNDSSVTTRTNVAALPIPLTTVTFTGFDGSNLPAISPGWIEGDGLTHPTILGTSDWTSGNFGNVSGASTSAKVNLYNTAHTDWIIGPKFLATSNTVVLYDLALTEFASTDSATLGSDDTFQVMVSTNCGASYVPVRTYDNTTSISNVGQNDTVSLAAFAGQEIIVAFFAKDAPIDDPEDNDLFLDNIEIRDIVANDVAALSVDSLSSSCGLSAAELVSVTYRNLGSQPVTNVLASFSVNGGTFSTPENAGALSVGATASYTFTQTADLSAPGSYTIIVVTTAGTPADQQIINDTATVTVENVPVISSLPYVENFENGTGGWTTTGTNSSWEFGTPAATLINSASSGSNAWATNLTGLYNLSENSAVVSPCFDMSNVSGNVWVGLDLWLDAEFGWDGANLQSSNDGGSTWENIGDFGDPYNWYNDDDIDGEPGGSEIGWSGTSAGWFRAYHPLDTSVLGKPDVRFRIAFGSDGFFNQEGIAFDNFAIGAAPVTSLGDTITACIGSTLDLGNPGAQFYNWSTGDTTQTITISNGTGVAITDSTIIGLVVDSIGFFAFDTVVVNIPASAVDVVASQIDEIACAGDMSALLVAVATEGDAPYSYMWSSTTGTPGDSLLDVGPGLY